MPSVVFRFVNIHLSLLGRLRFTEHRMHEVTVLQDEGWVLSEASRQRPLSPGMETAALSTPSKAEAKAKDR